MAEFATVESEKKHSPNKKQIQGCMGIMKSIIIISYLVVEPNHLEKNMIVKLETISLGFGVNMNNIENPPT